jgi:hypothetical protein
MLRITYAYHGHHAGYIFDWESLSAEMTRAGFTSLIRRQPNESNDDALCGLETRFGPSEAATQLIIEGRRPGMTSDGLGPAYA